MKKILLVLLLLFFLVPITAEAAKDEEDKVIDIHLFYLETCPHCKNEKKFLEELGKRYNIKVYKYEVSNKDNDKILSNVQNIIGSNEINVPYTVIGNRYMVGFNNTTKLTIENTVKAFLENDYVDVVGGIIDESITKDNYNDIIKDIKGIKIDNTVDIPFIGKVDPKNISIPLVAMVIGIVDGFNPCALWVLLFIISMLINLHDRKKIFIFGLTFIITSAIVYAIIMMAWLNIAISITNIIWIRNAIGLLAIIAGAFNLNKYVKERKEDDGCHVVDDKKRKRIISKVKTFTSEKSFWLAIFGVVALAVSVNIVELACSAGLPLLFTQILALNNLSDSLIAINMLIYLLFFLLDEIIIFTIAVTTFKITGITTKYTKWSHLIGGIIMLLIGALLVLKPEWIMLNF